MRTRRAPGTAGTANGLGPARRRGDHRRVVGAERERRRGCVRQRRPQRRVRGDAADDRDPLPPRLLRRLAHALDERPHDRVLVGSREVGAARSELLLVEVAHRVEQRRLQPREREVEAGHARHGEVERVRISFPREQIDLAAAGVAEPEQARALVECLARRVVEGRAEELAAPCASGRRAASCGRRWRAGRGTAARAGSGWR